MSPVEIEVPDTDAALDESRRLMGGWRCWLGIVLIYGGIAYGVFFLGFFGCYGVYLVIHWLLEPTPNWLSALGISPLAGVPLGLLGWGVFRRRRERHTTRVRATFSDKGLSLVDGHGESFSDAWSDYAGFYVGRQVILLPQAEAAVSARIPIDKVPGDRLAEIRRLLSEHLPELSMRDFRASVRAAKRRAG